MSIHPSRGHPKQQVAGSETLNLATKNIKKKRTWKVQVTPEFNEDDDDEEDLIKEVE
jgi:hypothetical protein